MQSIGLTGKAYRQRTSVDNVSLVQVVDGIENLANGLRSILLRELAVFTNAIEQLTTSGQLSDNVKFVLSFIVSDPIAVIIRHRAYYLRFEPVDKMDNAGVVEGLQHLQLVVDHLLIPTDILLQDDFDGDLPSDGGLGLPDNTICSCTKRSAKSIRGSIYRSSVSSDPTERGGRGGIDSYFFS